MEGANLLVSACISAPHINMQPLKFNKKHTNYESYLPSQINHRPRRVYV